MSSPSEVTGSRRAPSSARTTAAPGSAPAASTTRKLTRTQRVDAILAELHAHGSVQVSELSARLGASEATLRRDLALLEEQHLLTRTHGGALAPDTGYQLPGRTRDAAEASVRQAIGRLAARSLPAGPHVVGFTGGEVAAEVARQVAGRDDLTVVTAALNIAMDAAARGTARLIVLGGTLRPGGFELVGDTGPLAGLNLGTVVVQADGLSADGGLTVDDEQLAVTTGALVARAQRVVVVAPGRAVGRVALARVADLAQVHELITDATAAGPELSALQGAGLKLGLVTQV